MGSGTQWHLEANVFKYSIILKILLCPQSDEIQSLLKKDLQLLPQSLGVHGIWRNVTSTGNKEKDCKF